MFSILFLGFLIGMRHALEADHVAAVASMVSQSQSFSESIRLGAVWGLGHTLTLFLLGSIVILLDVSFPERIAMTLEFLVGMMLIGLGIDVVYKVIKQRVHFHMHQHGQDMEHFHAHSHAETNAHQHRHQKKVPFRALFIGMMHGMAGSAALILLTMQTVSSPLTGMIYMVLFGLGSVVGMAILSLIIMIPIHQTSKRITWLYNGLQTSVGISTISLGSYVLYQIGIVQGLLI